MSFAEKRNSEGKVVKATIKNGRIELCVTPFRGHTYIHVTDCYKDKSVSLCYRDFLKVCDNLDKIKEYNQLFTEVSTSCFFNNMQIYCNHHVSFLNNFFV